MSEAYVIEKGIPIPPASMGRKKGSTDGNGVRVTLRAMEPGDSIVVDQRHRFSLSNHCGAVGCNIVSRLLEDGMVRVWVTERSTPVKPLTGEPASVIDEITAGVDPHSCPQAQDAPPFPSRSHGGASAR